MNRDDVILVTGAAGFIGSRVVASLVGDGFRNVRCLVRSSSSLKRLNELLAEGQDNRFEVVTGNLLSRVDCDTAVRDADVVIHLAAGKGSKSFPDAFANSVVTTRNLLESLRAHKSLKRLVNVSSFAVYTNRGKRHGQILDENCPIESGSHFSRDAYCYAKLKQDELVIQYGRDFGLPYVIVRPGVVYGPGNAGVHGRVGIGTFGLFLHCGGGNTIPFTYVDNCADAIVKAALTPGVEGEVFNIVDDDLPTSRQFLKLYKSNVRYFRSAYLPHAVSYSLCYLWERYSVWSRGQLPNAFNRQKWAALWRRTSYTNEKLKERLNWMPPISTEKGLRLYFAACRELED